MHLHLEESRAGSDRGEAEVLAGTSAGSGSGVKSGSASRSGSGNVAGIRAGFASVPAARG
ncbi:MAG: hypothetical protein ACM3ZU_08410 [Bacteroidota bacterium]